MTDREQQEAQAELKAQTESEELMRLLTPQVPREPRGPEVPPLDSMAMKIGAPPLTSPPHIRKSWNSYFMDIARQVAARSTCDRASVGAVLVRDKVLLSTGYNGSPRGVPHCDDVGHLMRGAEDALAILDKRQLTNYAANARPEIHAALDHCVRTVHAEANALVQAAREGHAVAGATLYCTHSPCLECAKLLVNAGVVRVVYSEAYRSHEPLDLLWAAGIQLEYVP